ncbi:MULTISPECIES: hypothetical protein [unclassified Paraburkholderia]|nr:MULTISPECIES: hypothetical protein [unclassified Paraburkholderia]
MPSSNACLTWHRQLRSRNDRKRLERISRFIEVAKQAATNYPDLLVTG